MEKYLPRYLRAFVSFAFALLLCSAAPSEPNLHSEISSAWSKIRGRVW